MKVLFVMYDLGQISLACKVADEGNEVRVLERLKCWKNKIKRPGIKVIFDDLESQLKWVGKDGLIVFDYVGDGKLQDSLRKKGYSVFGGCEIGDELEENRQLGQDTFMKYGMDVREAVSFENINDAIKHVKKNRKRWVVKQNGQMDKGLNYVGQLDDAKDVLSILKSYRRIFKKNNIKIDLHERADGVEIAAGRFYNGNKWVGPVYVNLEHKNLFKGNLGPKTHEMGTLMWCEKNGDSRIYKETLKKIEPFLKEIKFKGYFDINCIVDKNKIYPLEATARLGQPTVHVQNALITSPWGEFMKAIADGNDYDLKYRNGFGIVVFLGAPPYPYKSRLNHNSPKGLEVFFKEKLNKEEKNNVHLEEISILRGNRNVVCGKSGYIAHVASFGKTVEKVRENVYNLVRKIVIPKVFYRDDIGLGFIERGEKLLKKYKWI